MAFTVKQKGTLTATGITGVPDLTVGAAGDDNEILLGAPNGENVGISTSRYVNPGSPHSTVWAAGINPERRTTGGFAIWNGLESNYQISPGGVHQAEWYVQAYADDAEVAWDSARPIHGNIVKETGLVRNYSLAQQWFFLAADGNTEIARAEYAGVPVLSVADGGLLLVNFGGALCGRATSQGTIVALVSLDGSNVLNIGGGASSISVSKKTTFTAGENGTSKTQAQLLALNAATEGAGTRYYVSNLSGGAEYAYSDGTVWRRFSDRSQVT